LTEEQPPGLIDRLVDLLAKALDTLGFNGNRLRWKWNRRKLAMSEAKAQTSVSLRSARGKHKMCRSCRALVPRSASTCPDCGADLGTVKGPGVGRVLSNILPGVSATTSLLLLVNGAVFVLMLMDAIRSEQSVGLFGGFSGALYEKYGAAWRDGVFLRGDWWRVTTAMFVHGGLIHFGFNSYALLNLGPVIEEEFGTERFWVVYLLTGISGNVFHVVLSRAGVVGASVALCGMVGLLLAYGQRVKTRTGQAIKAAMVRFGFMILIISLLPGISWQGHLGGFLAGLGLGWVIPIGRFRNRGVATLWQLASLAGVVFTLICFYKLTVRP
jgi:rhomboid protease GluP